MMALPTEKQAAKWIAGLAATGATGAAGTVQGALVQIDLTGQSVSAAGGSTINADLLNGSFFNTQLATDFFGGLVFGCTFCPGTTTAVRYSATITNTAGGSQFQATNFYSASGSTSYSTLLAPGGFSSTPNSTRGAFGVSFTLNGVQVNGLLFGTAEGNGNARSVTLDSFVYDDELATRDLVGEGAATIASLNPTVIGAALSGTELQSIAEANAVPEPSGLALLALGAAGIVTRRRRQPQ